MNLFSKIIHKAYQLKWLLYRQKCIKCLNEKLNEKPEKKRIFFFCTPTHSNLGDQAQLLCWLRLFREWYKEYEIIKVPTKFREFGTLRTIHKNIRPEDKIFIHSGYLFFDPHTELPFILDIVRDFYDRQIIILPQTVNIMDSWFQHITSQILNSNPNVTLICRDGVSLQKTKKLFPEISSALMPDVVTSLIGDRDFMPKSLWHRKRDGILFCLRHDLEKHYSDEEIDRLKKRFDGIKIDTTDTTIDAKPWVWKKRREALIIKMLEKFAKYQLIITDRYHGTIFSQIVNTPVIVINSADHKLSSGVKWFPHDVFKDNMFYAKDLDEAYHLALNVLSRNGEIIENPPFFKNKYYNKPIHTLL